MPYFYAVIEYFSTKNPNQIGSKLSTEVYNSEISEIFTDFIEMLTKTAFYCMQSQAS